MCPTPSRKGPLGLVSLHGLGVGYEFLTRGGTNPYPTVGRRKETCPTAHPNAASGVVHYNPRLKRRQVPAALLYRLRPLK
jgi:hypothetical protein